MLDVLLKPWDLWNGAGMDLWWQWVGETTCFLSFVQHWEEHMNDSPVPLGSLVGYNAHTLASLVMVRWKRNRATTGRTFRFQGKPWIWWTNTVTNIPYGKKAWAINAAAGGDKGQAMYVNALLQTPSQYDRLLSGSSTDLTCAIFSHSSSSEKYPFAICVPITRIIEVTCLLWQSATYWDSGSLVKILVD